MRFRLFKPQSEYAKSFVEWRRWFAWHPVLVDGELVWLEWLERKRKATFHEVFWEHQLPSPFACRVCKDKGVTWDGAHCFPCYHCKSKQILRTKE